MADRKRYFISSDIHGYLDEWLEALGEAGFDRENPNHILVVCGDLFDRGAQPLEAYRFVKSLPRDRRILIRGNHEQLLGELARRGWPQEHDIHNHTLDTLYQLHGLPGESEHSMGFYRDTIGKGMEYGSPEFERARKALDRERSSVYGGITLEVVDWIEGDEWVNYWETPGHIFVHSWIPVTTYLRKDKWGSILKMGTSYRDDWRDASQAEWDSAMWGCPWKNARDGLNRTGKVIVCGHWHTSDFFNNLTGEKREIYDCPVFRSEKYALIGLDACTAGSGRVNCMAMEEDEL